MHTDSHALKCHDCGAARLELASGFELLHRVTSDCKPWPPGGLLARCLGCGLVQTVPTPRWQQEAEAIYAGYTIYHQSGGVEQPVFNAATGTGRSRSDTLVEALLKHAPLPTRGRSLDIGCGNGAFLRACSRVLPGWALCGTEVSDKYKATVESIPGVERLYTGPLEDVPGDFDLISLIHVIEHIPAPRQFLRGLVNRLRPGGRLLLEVPDCRVNPFMLAVADHCSHFSAGMLARVAQAAGFEVLQAVADWVPEEISVLARRPDSPVREPGAAPLAETEEVFGGGRTLLEIRRQVEPLTGRPAFGIFGTSIAATWLDTEMGGKTRFFVDEDPHRIGKEHLRRPILASQDMPAGATLFVALPAPLASRVASRLKAARPDVEVVTP